MVTAMNKVLLVALTLAVLLCSSCTGRTAALASNCPAKEKADEEFLDTLQRQYFKYIWDAALSNSGLSRVRMLEADPKKDSTTITVGSSGFGIAGVVVGMERGFISRKAGVSRLEKICTFLESADRYHGMWSHWIDDETGKTIPFANPQSKDNGGDLVESAFLAEGLLVARQYLLKGSRKDRKLARRYDALWKGMEWDWYLRDGSDTLFWHWSPNYEWEKNFPLKGYNECLIAYILGVSSPTHPIPGKAYYKGWARDGAILNDTTIFGYKPIVAHNTGRGHAGPIFWTAFSYVGFNPKGLKDSFGINYYDVNVAHVNILRQYCIENPRGFDGYGSNCWGFTAGYSTKGYKAHNTKNDRGVVSPSGVLAAMPYAPEAVLEAARHFYYDLGSETWGPYGFYDAYIPAENRVVRNYLGNNECCVVPMIENYRTGLIWDLFMSSPEITSGLDKLGFTKED